MSDTLDPPRQAVFALQASRVLAAWLSQAFGAIGVLDLSFPRAPLAAAIPGSLAGIADPSALPQAEADFLQRFHNSGGRAPLFSAATAHAIPADAAWNQAGVTRIVYAETMPEPALLNLLLAAKPLPAFLLLADGAEGAGAALEQAGYRAAELHIQAGAEAQRYRFLLPSGALDTALSAMGGPGQPPGLAVVPGLGEGEVATLRIEATPAWEMQPPPLLATIPAADLIHDGSYRSEADGSYTWLWSGPDRHLRMALGSLPPLSRWLKVAIIGVPKAELLDNMAATLNGTRVPVRLERWSSTSAGVAVDLPAEPLPGLILGLSVPQVVQEEQGERRLGICVHKIEVFS